MPRYSCIRDGTGNSHIICRPSIWHQAHQPPVLIGTEAGILADEESGRLLFTGCAQDAIELFVAVSNDPAIVSDQAPSPFGRPPLPFLLIDRASGLSARTLTACHAIDDFAFFLMRACRALHQMASNDSGEPFGLPIMERVVRIGVGQIGANPPEDWKQRVHAGFKGPAGCMPGALRRYLLQSDADSRHAAGPASQSTCGDASTLYPLPDRAILLPYTRPSGEATLAPVMVDAAQVDVGGRTGLSGRLPEQPEGETHA